MNRKNFALAVPIAIYFSLMADIPTLLHRTTFYAFQSRDLNRALELLRGHPIFFGPEMTGGGNLPGPLYYILLLPSLLINANWKSAWIEMFILATLSAVILWWYLRSIGLAFAGLIACSLIAVSAVTQHFLTLFINPSYQFIFLIPILVCVTRAFDPGQPATSRGRSFTAAAVLIGLSIQVHYSVLFLAPAMIFLHAFAPRLGLVRVPRKFLCWAAVGLPLGSIPYLAWMISQRQGGQAWDYTGNVADVWPTLAHLLRAIQEIPFADLVAQAALQIAIHTPPSLVVLGVTLAICPREGLTMRARALCVVLAVCAGFSFIPFSYIFFVPIANRYGLPMVLSLLFLAAVLQETALNTRRKQNRFNLLSGLALIALATRTLNHLDAALESGLWLAAAFIAVLMANFNRSQIPTAKILGFLLTISLFILQREFYRGGELRKSPSNMLRYDHWQGAWSAIYKRTGWSVEEIKRRIYFVNAHIDGDPELMLRTVMSELGPQAGQPGEPDGYFILVNPPQEQTDASAWIEQQPVADEIKAGLKNHDIRLGEIIWSGVWVVPYSVNRESNLPRHFHNWGLYYNRPLSAAPLASVPPNSAGRRDGRLVFSWNECPGGDAYCNSGALVNVLERRNGRYTIDVNLVGGSLSQNSPWIHPTWTQGWIRPYIEVQCGSHTELRELASSVGYRREFLVYQSPTNYFVANNSLLAPLQRTFEFTCLKKISAITIGRQGGVVDSIRSVQTLPPSKLTVKL